MAAMEKPQINDIRAALPIWRTEANDLVELTRNAKRAVSEMEKRTLRRMRGSLGVTAGGHDTLLYVKKQDAAAALSADIRLLQASPDAMRTDVEVAVDVAASNVMSPRTRRTPQDDFIKFNIRNTPCSGPMTISFELARMPFGSARGAPPEKLWSTGLLR